MEFAAPFIIGFGAGTVITTAIFLVILHKAIMEYTGTSAPLQKRQKRKNKRRRLPKGWKVFKNNIM